jgi:hypothetical protein
MPGLLQRLQAVLQAVLPGAVLPGAVLPAVLQAVLPGAVLHSTSPTPCR